MVLQVAGVASVSPPGAPLTVLTLVFLVAITAGCGRDDIAVYEAPRDVPPSPATAASDPHAPGGMDPHEGMAMPANLAWETPEGWESQPAGGMRLANFVVPGNSQTGQVSVVVLPQVVGRDLEVLNIFRERLQVAPLEAEEVAGLGQEVPIGTQSGKLYDMPGGEPSEGTERNRLLVAVLQDDQASYYFNFFGPATLVEAQKDPFLAFLKSVTKAESAMAAAPPSAASPPATPAGSASASSSGLPRWTVPEGWRETTPTQMLLARFEAGGDDGKAEITVSMFPGDVGGTVANVNRWRGQIGLAPWNETEVNQALTTVEVEGGSAMLVEMVNREGGGRRLIGVIWPRGSHTWFYKMVGDDPAVAREKAALLRFVQSVRHTNA